MALMTRSEFARYMKVNASSVTKWVNSGKITLNENGYIDSEKAKKQLATTRTKAPKIKDEQIEKATKTSTNIPKDEKALKILLSDPHLAPITKAQIIKLFWQGREAKLSYLEKRKELVHLSNVREMLENMLQPLNRFLDDLPHLMRTRYPDTPPEAIDWLENEIQLQKKALKNYKWKR